MSKETLKEFYLPKWGVTVKAASITEAVGMVENKKKKIKREIAEKQTQKENK